MCIFKKEKMEKKKILGVFFLKILINYLLTFSLYLLYIYF